MPPHNNTTIGPGQFFIEMDGERIPMGEVTFCEITMEPEEYDLFPQTVAISREWPTITCSISLKRKSQKRFIKLCMSRGYQRNDAQALAKIAQYARMSYATASLVFGV